LSVKVFTPGPTAVPQSVLDSIFKNTIHHRSEEFKQLYKSLNEKLKKIFLTESYVTVLTGSGTAAMEAAVLNFCSSGDKALYVNQGRFGRRWGDICRAFGISATELYVEAGSAVSAGTLGDYALDNYNVIFLTHSETSTATLTDIKTIAEYIRRNSDALIIVDAITSIGAIEFRMDEWGVDCAVSASQKGLMCPPGLSVIAFNERAKQKMQNSDLPRFYFDLKKETKAFEQDSFTSWTPSIGLFFGLDTAADLILEEGLENVWARVRNTAGYFRMQSVKNQFKIFSKQPVDSLTALVMPEGIKSEVLIRRMKSKHGCLIGNGQDELKNRIIRVSHMGALTMQDFVELSELIYEELRIVNAGS
jgi:aspartate aminotransferase-like enzyme